MKIVILDGYSVNPGDLSWSSLEKAGELTVYDDSRQEQIVNRAENADALFINRCAIDKSILERLNRLRFIGTLGTGYNMINLDTCREKNIAVYNAPGYSTASVAQHIFAMMLQITNSVYVFDKAVRQGRWSGQKELGFLNYGYTALQGKTLGIIGLGNIGGRVAAIALQFGMRVIATSRTRTSGTVQGVTYCGFEELLKSSDFVSVNCPLTDQTRGLINSETIKIMKHDAVLINTARGAVIDESALANALNEGRIRAAALDVLINEPPDRDCPLLSAKNCIITPHIAWAAKEARQQLIHICEKNLESFINNSTENRII